MFFVIGFSGWLQLFLQYYVTLIGLKIIIYHEKYYDISVSFFVLEFNKNPEQFQLKQFN